ncbi:MAG: hypothetical protein J0M18_07970 [Ignavibacteria bacterium]|nr:hypothetical protein [Ignavibacteria bacterium]
MLPQNTIDILKTLNKAELKSLGDFINSPYFNSIEKLKDLFIEVSKSYPDFTSKRLEDEAIHKKLYPGKEFKQKSILNLFSDFGNLLKKFLSYEKFALQEDAIEMNLAKSLSERRLYDLSIKTINDFKKRKQGEEKFHEDYYQFFYKMERTVHRNLLNMRPLNKKKINEALNSAAKALMMDFLNKYSSLAYYLAVIKIVRPEPENNRTIENYLNSVNAENIMKYAESSDDKFVSIVKMQYMLYKFVKDNFTEEEYFELKEILLNNVNNFTPEDICIHFKEITDLAGIKAVSITELFDLRKKFCELKVYPNDSIPNFSAATLQNTFITAMSLGEYEWAENFLEEYINYIDEDLRVNEYNYSKALLNLRLKNYEKSLEHLNKIKYHELVEKINVRFYYLMNYIELGMYDSAVSMVKSIKQLERDGKERVKVESVATENSLRFFNEIIKSLMNNSKLDIAVYKEAQNETKYFYRYYILEKMKEMI